MQRDVAKQSSQSVAKSQTVAITNGAGLQNSSGRKARLCAQNRRGAGASPVAKIVSLRRCNKCRQSKPVSLFYPVRLGKYRPECKTCHCKAVRARRHSSLQSHAEIMARHRAKYPEREKARKAAQRAVKLGMIQKVKCAWCSGKRNLECAHTHYGKPLKVIIGCRPCHRAYDAGRLPAPRVLA